MGLARLAMCHFNPDLAHLLDTIHLLVPLLHPAPESSSNGRSCYQDSRCSSTRPFLPPQWMVAWIRMDFPRHDGEPRFIRFQ